MKNSKKLALAALVLGTSLAVPCFAQGWYADLGIGQSKLRDGDSGDNKKTAYAVRLGYRLNPNIAIDAGYYDLGKYDPVKVSSWGASLVATAPIDAFDIYGRIGYARTEAKAGGEKEHKNEAFYGAGGRYMFSPQLGLYAEYQRQDKAKIDTWMGGVQFRF